MARLAHVPEALTATPTTLRDAQRHGLGPWRLRTKAWQRIGPGIYLPSGVNMTPELRIGAASRRLPEAAVISGFTAAWLHGLDVEPCDPIEITVKVPAKVSARSGMKVRRRVLRDGDTSIARGCPVTSVIRTLEDLCARLPLVEAMVLLDGALHERIVSLGGLSASGSFAPQLDHVEPKTESPMETRMRMKLVMAGLPRPLAQVPIFDARHRLLGRPDLYYPEQRLGLEYDGGTHRFTMAYDNRRQNALLNAGVRLLRFTAGDIWESTDRLVTTVRQELGIISRVR